MWLDRRIIPPNPSNVVVGFDEGVGATFFDLNRLQVDRGRLLGICIQKQTDTVNGKK
jgi:hypothetical protein